MENVEISKWMKNNKIINMPKKIENKIKLFYYISNLEFELGVEYTEKDVNVRLNKYFEDYVLLRRYFIDFGLLSRNKDCSKYLKKSNVIC